MKSKQVLGIFIDGQLMKMALLRQSEGGVYVEALETAKLLERLDIPSELSEDLDEDLSSDGEKSDSPFGIDSDAGLPSESACPSAGFQSLFCWNCL